jgi:ATP-dependent RNA helicase DDX55/SPB4
VAPDEVAFSDAKKEELRQQELVAKAAEERAAAEQAVKKPVPKPEVEHKRTRSEKRETKRRHEAEEWDSLATEERLAKKLRAGKITQAEFDEQIEALDFDDSEDESTDDEPVVQKKRFVAHKNKAGKSGKRSLFR